MTFRTPAEAVRLANNTRYGLAATVWSENINLALDIAPQLKAGTVWVNCSQHFDAASGFGGYRESGYGREGGREGLWEYLKPRLTPTWSPPKGRTAHPAAVQTASGLSEFVPEINRTAKLYIGGKQVRPDSGYSRIISDQRANVVGEVGEGNRKDIRDAVEVAATQAESWRQSAAHLKAQILYYIAENLQIRAREFATRLRQMTGVTPTAARQEVELTVECLFRWAAWADKYDGRVHQTPFRNVTLAMPEPMGVVGIVADQWQPLLGLVSLVAPAVAMGNCVVVVPSEIFPLAATDFYQVLETSDLPGGVINIVTGPREALAEVLAGHDEVAAIWYFGTAAGSTRVEALSTDNMKRTWVNYGKARDWTQSSPTQDSELHYHATQIKNIWIPYGD